ncbi:MAG: hypothetical protein GF418_09335 [Chitinivibrionales bacterium]|nr:hypothetical protein [Chitinivibrionales bacterium]MBD3395811.1 hypothetical protein [Chitinivibrionales bacterium]
MKPRYLLAAALVSIGMLGCNPFDFSEEGSNGGDDDGTPTTITEADVIGTWLYGVETGGVYNEGRFDITADSITYTSINVMNSNDTTETGYVCGTWDLQDTLIIFEGSQCRSFGADVACSDPDTAKYDDGELRCWGNIYLKQ